MECILHMLSFASDLTIVGVEVSFLDRLDVVCRLAEAIKPVSVCIKRMCN